MPVLREIVAQLGFDLDKRSFKEADKRIDKTTGKLKATPLAANAALGSINRFIGAAAVGLGSLKLLELGSSANETLNLLNETFQENSEDVQKWAADFSAAAGRSEFQMREMAGTLGAVLNPLMERNAEAAANMATRLSELSIDLGSFFNTTDTDALAALRAGLVGETEPLKRFGVVMLESTLEAFRLSEGINKSVKSMTVAEKTLLRYNFILDQTALVHGDAARTSQGWANATKALVGDLRDLGTRLSLVVLPAAEQAVRAARDGLRAFKEWTKGTKLLEGALVILGAVGLAIAGPMLLAWLPLVLAFIAAAIALDEILTLFDGGDTIIGEFIDSIFGPGSAAEAVDNLKLAWDGLVQTWQTNVMPAMRDLMDGIEDFGKANAEGFGIMSKWADINADKLRQLLSVLTLMFPKLKLVVDLMKALGVISDATSGAFDNAFDFFKKKGTQRRADLAEGIGLMSGGAERTEFGVTRPLEEQVAAASLMASFSQPASFPQPASLSRMASFPQQSSPANVSIDNSVTVEVQGNATAQDAGRIAAASSEAQSRQARQTQAALTQELAGAGVGGGGGDPTAGL